MTIIWTLVTLGISYLLGSIPFGLIIVRLSTGKDVRKIESGRTGGTNVMRAAGFWAGALTTILDVAKSAITVWLIRWIFPFNEWRIWMEVLAPIAAILGHNYSVFIPSRTSNGSIKLHGGAGGTPAAGGAMGLWWPSLLIIAPIGLLIMFGIGYASVATMSVPLIATVIFAIGYKMGFFPWQYILYGVLAEALILWALRPNIRRLMNGTERLVGWRAKRTKKPNSDPKVYSSSSSSSSS